MMRKRIDDPAAEAESLLVRDPSIVVLEIEVKFFVSDLPSLRDRLVTRGGALKRERVFERNVRFDTAEDALLKRGRLLRLRKDKKVRLTFKGEAPMATSSEARVLEELEIQVDDFNTAAALINRLGFQARQVYEKYRETFVLGSVEAVLDELPFGNFVELEGEEVAIKAAASDLGLDWRERITVNYLTLMSSLKAKHNLAFDDLTFANFKDLSISIADVLT
jgi:adenylate cyclase class 2